MYKRWLLGTNKLKSKDDVENYCKSYSDKAAGEGNLKDYCIPLYYSEIQLLATSTYLEYNRDRKVWIWKDDWTIDIWCIDKEL